MNIEQLYNSRYEKLKFEGVDEYIDDLIESEVLTRNLNNIEELYIFLDLLENKLSDKIKHRIGKYKVFKGSKF